MKLGISTTHKDGFDLLEKLVNCPKVNFSLFDEDGASLLHLISKYHSSLFYRIMMNKSAPIGQLAPGVLLTYIEYVPLEFSEIFPDIPEVIRACIESSGRKEMMEFIDHKCPALVLAARSILELKDVTKIAPILNQFKDDYNSAFYVHMSQSFPNIIIQGEIAKLDVDSWIKLVETMMSITDSPDNNYTVNGLNAMDYLEESLMVLDFEQRMGCLRRCHLMGMVSTLAQIMEKEIKQRSQNEVKTFMLMNSLKRVSDIPVDPLQQRDEKGRLLIHLFAQSNSIVKSDDVQAILETLCGMNFRVLNMPDSTMMTPIMFSLFADSLKFSCVENWMDRREIISEMSKKMMELCPIKSCPKSNINQNAAFYLTYRLGNMNAISIMQSLYAILGTISRWSTYLEIDLNTIDQYGESLLDVFSRLSIEDRALTALINGISSLGGRSALDLLQEKRKQLYTSVNIKAKAFSVDEDAPSQLLSQFRGGDLDMVLGRISSHEQHGSNNFYSSQCI